MHDSRLRYLVTWNSNEHVWYVSEALDYGRDVAGPFSSKEEAESVCKLYNERSN